MGDTCGQLTQRGQLALHDDLILSIMQVVQNSFKLIVLALQFVGELLNQVQSLNLKRVLTEHLQRIRHLCHLVAPTDLDLRFEVAVRHAEHSIRKRLDTAQQHLTDEQPSDQKRAHDAEHADHHQENTALPDRLLGDIRFQTHGGLGRLDQVVNVFDKQHRYLSIQFQKFVLSVG